MKLRSFAAALIPLTASLVYCNASASTAHAALSMDKLALQVIDLTPADGIPAGYDLTPFVGVTYLNAQSKSTDPFSGVGTVFTQGTAVNRAKQIGGERATVSGDGISSLRSDSFLDSNDYYANSGATIDSEYRLTLRPHSAITISGHFGGGFNASGKVADIVGDGQASLHLIPLVGSGVGCYGKTTTFSYNKGKGGAFTPQDFNCSFYNISDSDTKLQLLFHVSTRVTLVDPNPTPAVPEPDSILMLAGGLATLGLLARRKRA